MLGRAHVVLALCDLGLKSLSWEINKKQPSIDQGLRGRTDMHCFPLMQFNRGTVTFSQFNILTVLGEVIAQTLKTQVFIHISII